MVCSFCSENNHSLRNKTTVTCPKLLVTQCNICYNFGHTTNFCKLKLEKPTPHSVKPQIVKPQIVKPQIVKPQKNNFLAIAARFAALEVKELDFDNSSEYDCDDETETNIVEKKAEESPEYDEDELPPVSAIVWGKGFASKYKTKKWSD